MTDYPIFRYTAEQWKLIAADLPSANNHKLFRMHMEANISATRFVEAQNYGASDPTADDHLSLAHAARAVVEAYQNPGLVIPNREDMKRRGWMRRAEGARIRLLQELSQLADKQKAIGKRIKERAPGRGRRPPFWRDHLLDFLISLWVDAGGRVASSVKPLPGNAVVSKADGCVYRKLDSAILVMKAAQNRV